VRAATESAPLEGCTHCGLPLARGARAGEERYCCSGCYLAHRLSHRGLEASGDRLLSRVVLSGFLAMGVMVFSLALYSRALHDDGDGETAQALTGLFRLGALAFSTPALLLLGVPLFDAVVALRRWLSAEALILAGAASAWSVSVWNTFRGGGEVYYDTATMVVVLYSLGRWLDVRAREKATEELRALAPERDGPVARLDADGLESEVEAARIAVGERFRVRPGEIVPVDGLILAGRSFVDTSALTGESQPQSLGEGDTLNAGTVLVDGALVVRATAAVGSRLRDEVERLLREALEQRSRWVRVADRLAGALLPFVLVLAAGTVLVRRESAGWEAAWLDALSVVLISCPCALGIATPLAFWTAMGAAYKRGVLVRGGEALERLARAKRIFLDKTGTLTSGEFELVEVRAEGLDEPSALRIACALELGSEHRIARSMRAAWWGREGRAELPRVERFTALPGVGVRGVVEGVEYELTRAHFESPPSRPEATWIELRRGDDALAYFALASALRPDAAATVARLKQLGLDPRVLTGDAEAPAQALARELDVQVEARLSPADKVARLRACAEPAAFVGDGLNDAAALAAAQVGITVQGGVAASLSAAQVNLLRPGLAELPEVIVLARRAVFAAQLNLGWAFLYNSLGLYFAATGRLSPIFAASAMVASSVFSALNSRRLVLPLRAEPVAPLRTATEARCALGATAPVRS
jgi:Cu2+-exporting ATPase